MAVHFDALKLSEAIEKIVVRGVERKYYRLVRGGRWYGGIATADCCGCNLRCVFCWSGAPRDHP
ncbi:MAG: molybdenum cofactor biosynthesis protein MoaA, partial [Thermoprotei archaeon]